MPSGDDVVAQALIDLLQEGQEEGAFGFLVEARPGFPLGQVLERLGRWDDAFVSLVGLPEQYGGVEELRNGDWTEENLGADATHAVRVRNTAPHTALKVTIVWSEEDRLHSLSERGYRFLGAEEMVRRVAEIGQHAAPNQPQRNLWGVLSEADRPINLTLDSIVEYYMVVYAEDAEPQDTPRQELTKLGLLSDHRLLGTYSSSREISRRLAYNAEMVARLQTGDQKDRQRALRTVEYAPEEDKDRLRDAYKAFLRLSRGETEAIEDLDLETADELFRKKKRAETREDGEELEQEAHEENDADGEDNNGLRKFEDIELAALELALAGDEEGLTELADGARRVLTEAEIQPTQVKTGSLAAAFNPSVRAVVLAQDTVRTDRLGGSISADEVADTMLKEIGRFVNAVKPIDAVSLEEIKQLAEKAEEVIADFEGGQLLKEFLDARTALLPDLELFATAPFTAIASGQTRETAKLLVSRYGRLVDHLQQHYAALKRVAADGAPRMYRSILALDVTLIEGRDESAALVAPVHPLVIWKYLEIANLCKQLGQSIKRTDRQLLEQELRDLPEPLSALFLPSLEDDPELGYVGRRIGAFPLYRKKATELADVSCETIERAGRKLLALYPAARSDFRLLLVNPVTTREASRAAKALVKEHGVEHITLISARPAEGTNIGTLQEDPALDELHAEGKVALEEIQVEDVKDIVAELEKRPVHLLVVSGQEEKGVEAIERETSRLHPLSIPHRLHADRLTNRVSLKPRSLQPEEDAVPHPFALYQDLVAAVAGNHRTERTMAQKRTVSLSDIRPLLPHCLFLCAAGIPEEEHDPNLIRVSQGSRALGDSTFTVYGDRIVQAIDHMLRKLNYEPRKEGIKRLIDQLEEIAADEIFDTISEKGRFGFSDSALKGLLGLAVALGWYRSTAAGGEFLVISMDTFQARQWLGHRDDGKRVDLIGFRKDGDGDVHVDVIEVKSYEATSGDVAESYPASQLLAVARVLRQVLGSKGDVLTDRRRELLRRQVYTEGLLVRLGADQHWVEALNDVLDGNREVNLHLKLIELAFTDNSSVTKETFILREPGTNIDGLEAERLRLGEREIQRQLAGLSLESIQIDGVTEIEVAPRDADGESGDFRDRDRPAPRGNTGPPETTDSFPEDERTGPEVPEAPEGAGIETTQEPSLGFEPSPEEQGEIRTMAKALYRAMRDVGVQVAEPVDPNLADIGPTVVRFKVRLRPEERTASVRSRARDIMRELAAEKEPIIDVLPNTSFVYVDIPRPQRQIARFRPEMAVEYAGPNLSVPFGVAPEGGIKAYDLAALPHMLVAGATGSGKTMFLYSLMAALVAAYGVEELHLILVDPKQTDFVYFDSLPHLRGRGVIIDPEVAIEVLRELLETELEARTEQLRAAKARDISAYNSRITEQMPRIVVIIDEFADLADVMEGGERDEFDASLRRLAQRARNVGIHLILATQRPTTDIVNGTIKANLPCRVSFRLSSHVDSQTILDSPGAEKLLGAGDMLVSWNGELRRLQGLFVDEDYLMAM